MRKCGGPWRHETLVKAGGVAGVVSGIITALLGGSSEDSGKIIASTIRAVWTAMAFNIVLALAGPIFVAVLIIGLSVGLDKLLAGKMRWSKSCKGAATTPLPCRTPALRGNAADLDLDGYVVCIWLADIGDRRSGWRRTSSTSIAFRCTRYTAIA